MMEEGWGREGESFVFGRVRRGHGGVVGSDLKHEYMSA
jgi:hypothetical protein